MPQAQSDIYFNNYQPEFACSAGINYLLSGKSKFGFEADLLLSYKKGFYLNYKEVVGTPYSTEIVPVTNDREKLYFLKLPALLHIRLWEKSSFTTSAFTGLQPIFLLKEVSELNDRTKNNYVSPNYSFVAGVGTLKKLSEKLNLLAQLRLEYVADIQEFYDFPGYSFGAGDFYAGLMMGITFNKVKSPGNKQSQ